MKTSESIVKITGALLNFQKNVVGIKKDGKGYGYDYITIDSILLLVRPALSAEGIVLMQDVSNIVVGDEVLPTCETRLLHSSGEWISTGALIVKPVNISKKGEVSSTITPQNLGSAITYSKRYQLTALLGLSADVDDDAAAISQNKQAWGQKISQEQINLLAELMKVKHVDKEHMKGIMVQVLQTSKSSSQLTGEEADKLIAHMTKMQVA